MNNGAQTTHSFLKRLFLLLRLDNGACGHEHKNPKVNNQHFNFAR